MSNDRPSTTLAGASRRRSVALVGAATIVATAGCVKGQVVRVFDGVERPGRFVSEVAYATYAHGAELEAAGRAEEALGAYEHAALSDPESVETWTRIGALRCRLARVAPARAAFDRAEQLDPDYEPLWSARARCAGQAGRLAEAIAHARRALGLAPEQDDAVLLLAELLDAAGARDEAGRLLTELTVRSPGSLAAWRALGAHADAAGDAAWREHAERRLGILTGQLSPAERPDPGLVTTTLGEQLRRGELGAARRTARRGRLDPHVLPVLALALGRPALARAEAALRTAADPADSDAHVAHALAADRDGDVDDASRILGALASPAEPLDPLGRAAAPMLVELLHRHLGAEVAEAWQVAFGVATPLPPPATPDRRSHP